MTGLGLADAAVATVGGVGALTVTEAVPCDTPPLAACTVALPAEAPALYRPEELIDPTPLLTTLHVNAGCGDSAVPF